MQLPEPTDGVGTNERSQYTERRQVNYWCTQHGHYHSSHLLEPQRE